MMRSYKLKVRDFYITFVLKKRFEPLEVIVCEMLIMFMNDFIS